MNKEERIRHVILALKRAGYIDEPDPDDETDGDIIDEPVPDDEIGKEVLIACGEFLQGESGFNGAIPPSMINPVITALKEADFNNALVADGDVGTESVKAIKAFLVLGLTS